MALTAFLFSWVLALRMRGIGSEAGSTGGAAYASTGQARQRWAVFGLLWWLIALSNPAILILLPVCGFWILAGRAVLGRGSDRQSR